MTLTDHQKSKQENYIKKLVSNSRAIISNQIALPLGVSKMTTIISWINQIDPIENIDLKVFQEYMSKTKNLPLGTERLTYSRDFLKLQDLQLDKVTMIYKDRIIDKCFEIIKKFSNESQ
ncbi:hypothetical protein ACFQZI_04395 [Mucilaginibacter lutimaris]|uniref:Uncharacterized protein n=1 Tax=Mucilaginibacter lutimaris TaxID=931629 RepID=A0ABW2ZD16_9SPHI